MASFLAILTLLTLLVGLSWGDNGRTSLWPRDACTDKSLTIPSWTIRDFKIRSDAPLPAIATNSTFVPTTNATVSFSIRTRVYNRETGFHCRLDQGSCQQMGPGPLKVAVQIINGSAQILTRTMWWCTDKQNAKNQRVK